MGKKFAPSLTNMYMRNFDKWAMRGNGIAPQLYFWFLDDIHFVRSGTRQQPDSLQEYLNGLVPGIRFH